MRVLVHHIFYKPELTGTAAYTAGLCERLAQAGHEVEVICPPPYFPFWKVQEPYSAWRYQTERISGVRVSRCPVWLPRRPGGVSRILYEALFVLTSLPRLLRALFRPPDLMMAVEPTLLSALPVLAMGWLAGAHTWLHVQDFEIDLALATGEIRNRGLRAFLRRLDRGVRRRFDTVSSISRRMCERLAAKNIAAERIVYFPNWADTEAIRPDEPSAASIALRNELGAGAGSTLVLYSGSINRKQGIDGIIDAANILRSRTDIVFAICGDGAELPRLRELARHLPNLRFLPLQPAETLNDLLNAADVHLLTQRPAVADLVMPSKLLAMLASGRPIIATVEPGSEIFQVVTGCGVITPPANPHALAKAVADLAGDPERRRILGARARRVAVEHFDADLVLTGFEQAMLRRVPGFDPPPLPAEVSAGVAE